MKKLIDFSNRYKYYIIIILVSGTAFWFCIPDPLFSDPFSTVITDRNNNLLGARIADDGQWRFPAGPDIPEKYKKSVLLFEDRYFYIHPGINPVSLVKAAAKNIRAGKVKSGGSTISMQVIRLSRKGKPRTVYQKLIEMIQALRLELSLSKEEILLLYTAHAPFGGNVVGIEAASWRYFGRDPHNLSWSESAMLAVLPNSPSLIHPGRNRESLKSKRNLLLKKLLMEGEFDSLSYELSIEEPLPDKPFSLPRRASHLLEHFYKEQAGKKVQTSIDFRLQEMVEHEMELVKERLYANNIHNAACLIVDVKDRAVLAYFGNIRNDNNPEYGGDVDVIKSPRSSGSILKPLLYAEMIQRGEILPGTLIPDIPSYYGNFSPKNNVKGYDGAVAARLALSRSLNIPAVRMLRKYGVERFYHDLKQLGFNTLTYPSSRYGLSLILGGAETSLWDLAGVYSSLASVVNHYNEHSSKYFPEDFEKPTILNRHVNDFEKSKGFEQGLIGSGAIYLTFNALTSVNRPEEEIGWQNFASTRRIAWKTGTSFGNRDSWAIGITPEYCVSVWTGNASGEGSPELTGLTSSAPILFALFNNLPPTTWFGVPYDDLKHVRTCSKSGHLAGPYCVETDSVWVPKAGLQTNVCPYHVLVHLDKESKQRVNSDCYPVEQMVHEPWFILPPLQEYYFLQKNASYKTLPPFRPGCTENNEINQMQMVYPENGTIVYVPVELNGERGRLISEAIHRNPGEEIFWHLDDKYLGKTKNSHQMAILPEKSNGNSTGKGEACFKSY